MTVKHIAAGAFVAALLAGTSVASAQEFVLAHGANPGNPRYDAANLFAALVEQYSDGEMTVSVAPSATLGDDAEMLTSVLAGVIEMSANSQGAYSQIIPEAGALGLPFLFNELPVAWEVLDGPIGDELNALSQAQGFEVVTWWDNGLRNVTHTGMSIDSPADIEGMQIRTPPDELRVAMFEALGAAPSPLAWSELPTALRNGVFDGQENPLTNIYSASLHEITPYISMTAHAYEGTPVVANLDWWNSLSDDQRDIISRAASEAGWYQRGASVVADEALVSVLESEGAVITYPDTQPFIDATAGVYDQWQEQMGDFVANLREAAVAATN